MKIFDANISSQVANLLCNRISSIPFYDIANKKLVEEFGMKNFFSNQEEYLLLKKAISSSENVAAEPDRTEYGDFQTNYDLAFSVVKYLDSFKHLNPKFLIEPTCGKGNFIIAALSVFKQINKVIGVEIYKPYIWETKFNIIEFYISNKVENVPEIEIYHFNVFDFDFSFLAKDFNDDILILGNPPWVTNSKLSSIGSINLPKKSNFKKHNGLDAITGKGNFDIGEYIALMLLNVFQHIKGHLALLLKNSVIKNIVFDQYQHKFKVSNIEKFIIDSKKEFDASVDAALLFCKLNSMTEFTCNEYNFYFPEKHIRKFGWINNKFVSNIDLYSNGKDIDGTCPIEWRQGIKHDLASIMELDFKSGYYINAKDEKVILEDELIYGLLKSSDLKQEVILQPRKFTIITQKKIGQDTTYIKLKYPQIFKYLHSHKNYFSQRKSSIYNNKPDYSIFGIGDYSFSPYKVAISGLYKTFSFSLILPFYGKPVMLDDTCYLLGFDCLEFAAYTTILLNCDKTKEFLQSITFLDAKRIFTKDILMRIDLYKLAVQFSSLVLEKEVNTLNKKFNLQISLNKWNDFLLFLKPKSEIKQMNISF